MIADGERENDRLSRGVVRQGQMGDRLEQMHDGTIIFFFSSRRRHTRFDCDWSSDVCSSDLSSTTPIDLDVPILPLTPHAEAPKGIYPRKLLTNNHIPLGSGDVPPAEYCYQCSNNLHPNCS